MKKSLKTYVIKKEYDGYKILVYGERWEDGQVDGICITRAKFSRDGRKVLNTGNATQVLLESPYTRTRYFNMGWAICAADDTFDEAFGINLCKKRFRKHPLTAKTGLFLTNDMIYAIMENEVRYIIKHWNKFVPHYHETDKRRADEEPTVENAAERLERKSPEVTENTKEDNKFTVRPGMIVSIGDSPIHTFGSVKKVDANNVFFDWVVQFDENFFNLDYSYGIDKLKAEVGQVKPCSNEEIVAVFRVIKQKTGLVWHSKENRFVKQR